jgi:hypothetical protein
MMFVMPFIPPIFIFVLVFIELSREYWPILIAFGLFIGTISFLIIYIIIKLILKHYYLKINKNIILITEVLLNIIKISISVVSYLALFGIMIWLTIKFEPMKINTVILISIILQVILLITMKIIKKMNDVYFTIFCLIEPYLFLYMIIWWCFSK